MSDKNTKDIRQIRENQIKLQTQFKSVMDSLSDLSNQIASMIDRMDKHNDKLDGKVETLEAKFDAKLKDYVQSKDIQVMQRIIYGSVGTVLTFVGIAILGLLIDQS